MDPPQSTIPGPVSSREDSREVAPDCQTTPGPCGSRATTQPPPPDTKCVRVQFGADAVRTGGKEGWGRGGTGRRGFKEIVLNEVMGVSPQGAPSCLDTGSSSPASNRRGILKLRGQSKDSDKQSLCFVNQAYLGDDGTVTADDVMATSQPAPAGSPTSTVATISKSAFPCGRRRSSQHGFAGVVELLVQRSSLDMDKRDVHPFGKDWSVEAMVDGRDVPKRSVTSAFSKLVLWVTLLSFLLGAAVGVIFLSETYNAKHRDDLLMSAALNESQLTS